MVTAEEGESGAGGACGTQRRIAERCVGHCVSAFHCNIAGAAALGRADLRLIKSKSEDLSAPGSSQLQLSVSVHVVVLL